MELLIVIQIEKLETEQLKQCTRTFKQNIVIVVFDLLSHLLVAGCDIGVHLSVRLSTFMSKFDIYVKVSILINYKTKQPSNLA